MNLFTELPIVEVLTKGEAGLPELGRAAKLKRMYAELVMEKVAENDALKREL